MKTNNCTKSTRLNLLVLRGCQTVKMLTSLALLLALCLPVVGVKAQRPAKTKQSVAVKPKSPVVVAPVDKKEIKLPGLPPKDDKSKIKLSISPHIASHKRKVGGGGLIEAKLTRGLLSAAKEKLGPASVKKDTEWVCSSQPGFSSYSYEDTQIFDPKPPQVYPGAIYDPKHFIMGNLKEKTVARKPITITTECYAFGNVTKTVSSPNQGTVNAKIAEMVKPDAAPCSNYTVGSLRRLYSYEDAVIKTSGSGHYMTAGGSHDLSYQSSNKSFKYMLDVSQNVYSITTADKNGPTDFFYTSAAEVAAKKILGANVQTIDASQIGPNWIYIKSVTYGRRLLLIFESSQDLEKFGVNVKAFVEGVIAGGQGEVDVKTKSVASQVCLRVITIGGDANAAGQLADGDWLGLSKKIKAFFSGPVQVKPLAYHLSTISGDDVGISFTGEYTARQCTPLAQRYQITWTKLYCTENDDSDDQEGTEQVRASASITAFDGQGKLLMDEEKKNQLLATFAPTANAVAKLQGLDALPPTFMLGSENSPRYLKEIPPGVADKSGSHPDIEYPNRSVTFKLPNGDKNVNIRLWADILEFDTGPNDSFTSDAREYSLAELPINTPIKLTTRHEASRIVFEFVVKPIY